MRKRRVVKNSIEQWKADIICLQETKLQGNIQEVVKQIWGGRWIKYAFLEASGTRGGIIMLWDRVHTLTCIFEALLQNFTHHISGVYAPNFKMERTEVWDDLGVVKGLIKGPWAVCGDFNVCRFLSEKRNCQRRSNAMVEFSDTLQDLELIDLPLEGGTFTWFKGDTYISFQDTQNFVHL
ncbi:unnamed protein product [Withania somnifera]